MTANLHIFTAAKNIKKFKDANSVWRFNQGGKKLGMLESKIFLFLGARTTVDGVVKEGRVVNHVLGTKAILRIALEQS